MSIPFFKDVLKALGKSLNYAAVVNLFGNAFAKDAGKAVEKANPLFHESAASASGLLGLLDMSKGKLMGNEVIKGADWAVD